MVSRRSILEWGLHTSAALSLFRCLPAQSGYSLQTAKYGPLKDDPAGIVALPVGFTYEILAREGDIMQDGFRVPGAFDGMGAFRGPAQTTVLVRNHELSPGDARVQPFHDRSPALAPGSFYDGGDDQTIFPGGTTTMIYDEGLRQVTGQYLSLVGTIRNCAGGVTPWHTWISCEETTIREGQAGKKDHGYCFEINPMAGALQPPRRLTGLGRFRHEAVAIDSREGFVYQTEDQSDGLFYRFMPSDPRDLAGSGKLQALALRDLPSFDTKNEDANWALGQSRSAYWIDLEDTSDPQGDLRYRGRELGAATFCRGEGMVATTDHAIVFVTTSGGSSGDGQIWLYRSRGRDKGELTLVWEAREKSMLRHCDNICIAPNGDLILAEDHGGGRNGIIGMTPQGTLYPIARNMSSPSEVAGCCWSPRGDTLFFNIFHPGITLAIRGPW